MRRLLTALGSPQERLRAIHVVGTNGKSSTVRMAAAILQAHGLTAGAYLSPHLTTFAERIRIADSDVEPAAFAAAVLAFPAGWRQRLIGFLLGFLGIQVLNLIRVVSLVWIGRHRPALFDSSHTVIWQSAVVLFGVLIFLFWASRQRPRPANAEEKAGR